jgi:cell division protease FtsH
VTEKEKRVLAFHEAGHAVMSYLMGELMPLQKVSIVSRGDALGMPTTCRPKIATCARQEELIDSMKITLAGRAAEQVVFGRVTHGRRGRPREGDELARAMVFEYGMSETVTSGRCALTTTRCPRRRSAARPGAGALTDVRSPSACGC